MTAGLSFGNELDGLAHRRVAVAEDGLKGAGGHLQRVGE